MKRFMIFMAAVAALVLAPACEKYDDGRPPKDARSEFDRMYPDAWDIEWDYEGTAWVVDFETGPRPNGVEHTAIFDVTGNWISTETELPLNNIIGYLAFLQIQIAHFLFVEIHSAARQIPFISLQREALMCRNISLVWKCIICWTHKLLRTILKRK